MEYDKIAESILALVKDTVGYSETSNKTEFIKGARVGISKAIDVLKVQIESLQNSVSGLEFINNDLTHGLKQVKEAFDFINEFSD